MNLPRWVSVAWWCVPVFYIGLLAAPSVVLPGDDLGVRRFQTPPLAPDLRMGQTFTMTSDGLYAIEVFPGKSGEQVSGDVRFELYELRGNETIPVRVAEMLAEDIVRASSYRFEFAPILDSKDRGYRLDLLGAPAMGCSAREPG